MISGQPLGGEELSAPLMKVTEVLGGLAPSDWQNLLQACQEQTVLGRS